MLQKGTLYVVATPIGNLQDITFRAIDVLKDVDVIAAEDTRHSQKLLNHYDISTRLTSLHDHNESQKKQLLVKDLESGLNVALISDAGTPLISDPGYGLVNLCREQGITVVPIAGPCAAIAALSASGLATDKFVFYGFLPVKHLAKQQALETLINDSATTVFYESPRRVVDTLTAIVEVLGGHRQVVIAKEISKTFETFHSATAEETLVWLKADDNHQRGEFVIMVGGNKDVQNDLPSEAIALLKLMMAELPLKKAAAVTAAHYDLKKNALYQYGLSIDE